MAQRKDKAPGRRLGQKGKPDLVIKGGVYVDPSKSDHEQPAAIAIRKYASEEDYQNDKPFEVSLDNE